jgi:UDP:flavonoid glycosyltransferase YjiC (YdhE family)
MNENAARVDWAGVGVRLPGRYTTPPGLRLAVGRALAEPARRRRAQELAVWARAVDPPAVAAQLVEDLARRGG